MYVKLQDILKFIDRFSGSNSSPQTTKLSVGVFMSILHQSTESVSFQSFIHEVRMIVPEEDIRFDRHTNTELERNTLAVDKKVMGIIFPRTVEQIQVIVKAANKYKVALYPISQGKNIGYGELTPYSNDQVILNLCHLKNIRDYDSVAGEIVVEPGVTQADLAQFLKQIDAPFWADVTGATPEASILGNTLEGGFGHTPMGDHRKHVVNVEAILADGRLIQAGEMPALGPDLTALFIQSNLAVITAIKISLMPIPAECKTFILTFATEEQFLKSLPTICKLKNRGIINNLLHFGNATRTLITSGFVDQIKEVELIFDEATSLEHFNKNSPIQIGAWSAAGAIYGGPAEVNEKLKILKSELNAYAKLKTFSDRQVNLINTVLNLNCLQGFKLIKNIRNSFQVLNTVHGLLRGQPSHKPTENLIGRNGSIKNLGLAWFAPVVPAREKELTKLLQIARNVFTKHGFLMPLTLTLVNSGKLIAVFNIKFDKLKIDEVEGAHQAYAELSSQCYKEGFFPYRAGLLTKLSGAIPKGKAHLMALIKKSIDPQNIIAPGRYQFNEPNINLKFKAEL